MHAEFWWGTLRNMDHLEDLGFDGKIIQVKHKNTP
jgi:hypothetical protein